MTTQEASFVPADYCGNCWQKAPVIQSERGWICTYCQKLRVSGIYRTYAQGIGAHVVGYVFQTGYALCKPCHTQFTPKEAAWPPQLDGHSPMKSLYWKVEYTGGLSCCFCQRSIQGWW